jgi:hypothetical protein
MALSTQAELNALRAKNQEMATELRELAAELAQAKSLIPEPEDPKLAYVGPGTLGEQ